MTGYESKRAAAQDKITDIDGHVVRNVRKPRKLPQRPWVDYEPDGRMAAQKFIEAENKKVSERYGYVPKLHSSEWQDNLAQPEQEPDWKGLVLTHNAECDERCDKERCGYAPYFEANGRRCPTCPVYEKIDVDTPPQRTWVGLTEKDFSAINQSCLTKLQAAISAESILKEKNNGT